MSSIFNEQDAQSFIQRIEKLTPITQHIWGTMTVSQMLAHIQQPIKVALGEIEPKRSLLGLVVGRIAKRDMINSSPFKKKLPTDPSFVVKNERNFEEEKQYAIALIERLSKINTQAIANKKHPIFGRLTAEEWDVLTVKHLDHHLRQFGV